MPTREALVAGRRDGVITELLTPLSYLRYNLLMKRLVMLLLATCAALPALCQDQVDGFVARVFQKVDQTMPYRLFIPPKYNKSRKYPLIIWLHGAGGVGADNLRQIQGDQIPGTHIWTAAGNQARYPAFVVVPQSTGAWDSTGVPNAPKSDPKASGQLTTQLSEVMGILDSLKMEFNIDDKRLYVVGQSMGGFGTWNLITKKPDVFAAAIILCGGGSPALAPNVKHMAIWSFQGDQDHLFADSNRNMIAAIRKAGGNPRYTEYPGMGHEIWDRVFKEPGLVEWLYAHHQ
jgi:predicted peptidase